MRGMRRPGGRSSICPYSDRDRAQRTAVKRLVSQLFDGSPGSLVLNVLEHEQVDAEEIARLRKLLKETK